jgi:hypothetical protein
VSFHDTLWSGGDFKIVKSTQNNKEIFSKMRKHKGLMAMIFAFVLIFTVFVQTPLQAVAAETPSDWATAYVETAQDLGILPEHLASNFTAATTRVEFAALATALFETVTGEEIQGRAEFVDTDDENVQKMGYLGVITGFPGGIFAPDDELTREQAATMISRLAAALETPLPAQAPDFADNADISDWAFDAVGEVQATGIMGGVGGGRFAPGENYTREMSIITMVRLYNYPITGLMPEVDPIEPIELPGGISPFEALNTANAILLEAGSYRMSMDMSMMTIAMVMGESEIINMEMNGVMDVVARSETDIDSRMELTVSVEGEADETAVSYFSSGTMYTYVVGEWIRSEIDVDQVMAQFGMAEFTPAGILFEAAIAADEGYELMFILSGDYMEGAMDLAFAGMGDLGLDDLDLEVRLDDVTMTVLIDEDFNLLSLSMIMRVEMVMEVEGFAISFTIDTTVYSEVVQVGDVTVEFPAELSIG